jgi:hypothetical protein
MSTGCYILLSSVYHPLSSTQPRCTILDIICLTTTFRCKGTENLLQHAHHIPGTQMLILVHTSPLQCPHLLHLLDLPRRLHCMSFNAEPKMQLFTLVNGPFKQFQHLPKIQMLILVCLCSVPTCCTCRTSLKGFTVWPPRPRTNTCPAETQLSWQLSVSVKLGLRSRPRRRWIKLPWKWQGRGLLPR